MKRTEEQVLRLIMILKLNSILKFYLLYSQINKEETQEPSSPAPPHLKLKRRF